MIVRVGYEEGMYVHIDDERLDRMTPEVLEDYVARAREQVLLAYKDQIAYDITMREGLEPIDEADDWARPGVLANRL